MNFRVTHYPQVGTGVKFTVEVPTIEEAIRMAEAIAFQHLLFFDNNIIPDYANIITIEEWVEDEWLEYESDFEETWEEYRDRLFEIVWNREIKDTGILLVEPKNTQA